MISFEDELFAGFSSDKEGSLAIFALFRARGDGAEHESGDKKIIDSEKREIGSFNKLAREQG